MSTKTWRFTPHDTWFFRESRPHGVVGGAELGSVFPPPARTLAGASRFLMGEAVGVDWRLFKDGRDGKGPDGGSLRDVIGGSNGLGQLRLRGPWLARGDGDLAERLYPAPAFLFRQAPRNDQKPVQRPIRRLILGSPTRCDLGTVRLARYPDDEVRGQALDNAWLTAAGLSRVLGGGTPAPGEVVDVDTLVTDEPRLGIARDNGKRTNLDGLLYQTRHLRLRGLCVELDVTVPDERLQAPPPIVRLGGEGRMATVAVAAAEAPLPAAPPVAGDRSLLALCLLTAADLGPGGRPDAWVPPGLVRRRSPDGATVWSGAFEYRRRDGVPHTLPLTLESAILRTAGRQGGWDLAKGKHGAPRPVRSLVPAGSVWLCRVGDGFAGGMAAAVAALHGAFIGNDYEIGRGQLAVGRWQQGADQP